MIDHNPLYQCATFLTNQVKSVLSNTAVTIGAPITGGAIGIFLRDIIPILTVASLLTGIVLGILSYRLKLKEAKRHELDKN